MCLIALDMYKITSSMHVCRYMWVMINLQVVIFIHVNDANNVACCLLLQVHDIHSCLWCQNVACQLLHVVYFCALRKGPGGPGGCKESRGKSCVWRKRPSGTGGCKDRAIINVTFIWIIKLFDISWSFMCMYINIFKYVCSIYFDVWVLLDLWQTCMHTCV